MNTQTLRTFFSAALVIAAATALHPGDAVANVFAMGPGLTNLEFVPVGNPGNPADPQDYEGTIDGYGAVSQPYRIGKYEVTSAQYTQFLNAVAKTDAFGLYNASMFTDDFG